MERNMALVRQICFAIEKLTKPTLTSQLHIDGFDSQSIVYHCEIMYEAGLFKGHEIGAGPDRLYQLSRLTWAGHEFVDAVRNETVWNQLCKDVRTSMTTISFSVLTEYATRLALQFLPGGGS